MDDNNEPQNAGGEGSEQNAHENPEQPAQAEPLELMFTDASGFQVSFRIKTSTKMSKAMNAFSTKTARDPATLRFLVDGQRVLPDDTPASVSCLSLPCVSA